jgi:periplasmic protein TonB
MLFYQVFISCRMKIILTSLLVLAFCAAHSQTDSAVYFNPEITASYPGGLNAWAKYLTRNMSYPEKALRKGIQGEVVVQFIVDSTGVIRDISAISGPNELFEESIKLIKKSGIWVPAVANSKRVNAWYSQSFKFKMEN